MPVMQGLYAIVDLPHPHGLFARETTAAVLGDRLEGGIDGASVVQLRAKRASTAERVELLRAMGPLCSRAGVPLVVNDDIEAATSGVEGIRGVHLGQEDPGANEVGAVRSRLADAGVPDPIVGVSTHGIGQFQQAQRQRPDYLALGPIGPTRSKENPDPIVGFDTLLHACRLASRPVVAIGGMTERSGCEALYRGSAAVAVISALVDEDVEGISHRARRLARAFREAAQPLPFDEVVRRVPVLSVELLTDLARFADDLGTSIALGLPARFAPRIRGEEVLYRHADVLDLLDLLDKRPDETWENWESRCEREPMAPLVQLRSRS